MNKLYTFVKPLCYSFILCLKFYCLSVEKFTCNYNAFWHTLFCAESF